VTQGRRRVYVDLCGLQRPFDRVDHLPAAQQAAVAATFAADVLALGVILEKADIVASPMHRAENGFCPDPVRKAYVSALLNLAPIQIPTAPLTSGEQARLAALLQGGLKNADATHIVYAEGSAELFASTDERLLKRSTSIGTTIPTLSLIEVAQQL
jgi:hypothetical protein